PRSRPSPPPSATSPRWGSRRSSTMNVSSPASCSTASPRSPASGSSATRRRGSGPWPSMSTGSTPMTSDSTSTLRAWPCVWDTTAPSRCTAASVSPPRPERARICTTTPRTAGAYIAQWPRSAPSSGWPQREREAMTTPMQQLYQQVSLDQSRARTGNAELLGDAVSAPHGYSHQVNPTCGDEIELELEIDDEDHVTV